MPAAETDGGVAVTAAVEQLLGASSPRTRRIVRMGLHAIDWAVPPRRLSRRSPASAAAALVRLERSRSRTRRRLLHGLKALVCLAYCADERVSAAVGVRCECALDPARETPPADPPVPPLRREALAPAAPQERCDVVIVGSGAGGAAAARVLAERGVEVIVVEQGPYQDAGDYSSNPIRALPALYRDAGLTFCEGAPMIPLPTGRCVGGTTVINSGTCLRAPDDVLERWRESYGIGWATELDFAAVERALQVAPVDPRTAGRNAELCRVGAERLGLPNGPLPRNAGAVMRCSCCPTGCPLDAKRAAHVSELRRAAAAGVRVRSGTRIERVLLEHGRAAGVAGPGYQVRARAVVLAAGALGTPELLLHQRLANSSGAVGRHLRIHPACWVGARFAEPVRGWEGVMQSWSVDAFRERGLFLEATATPLPFGAQWLPGTGEELTAAIAGYGHLATIGVHLSERCEGRVTLGSRGPRIAYRLGRTDAQDLKFGIARAAEIHFAAGALEVYPQLGRLSRLGPDQLGRIERARTRASDLRLEAFHPMGTARMGSDPRSCVVAPSGETHDVPGLWVADASLFPTSLKVNPMLTIMACARQIALTLAERISQGA